MEPRSTLPASGPSLTAVTSRTAVAVLVSSPSLTVKLSGTSSPLKSTVGVNVQVPSPLSKSVPKAGSRVTSVTDRASPSTSELLASKSASLKMTALSSTVEPRSTLPASGPSLTAVTSRTAVAVLVSSPSLTVKLSGTSSPLKSTVGVNVQVPSPLSKSVPYAGSTEIPVIDNVSPSRSELLASKSASEKVVALSSAMVPRSTSPAMGAVLASGTMDPSPPGESSAKPLLTTSEMKTKSSPGSF